MTERPGLLAAVLSSAFGGVAAAATRFVIPGTDPITLAAFRFGLGFLFLLPIALARRRRWPPGRDMPAVLALGLLFFAVFFVLFNVALRYTTAARGTLALSTLPLLTMVIAAALGVERLTGRKTAGVLLAIGGVAVALIAGAARAPAGAWRGDLVMVVAALCMALYSVGARPYIGRAGGVGGDRLPGPVRRRARLLPVGIRAGAHDADPGGEHHHGQPRHGLGSGRSPPRRADRAQPRRGRRGSRCRHMDRLDELALCALSTS